MSDRIPAYCRHRATGQAYVTIEGREHYLGKYGTAASRQAYNRLIAEWIANDRHLPAPAGELTIVELIARFTEHAKAY